MSFNQIPGKSATYDDIKSDKKESLTLLRQHIFWDIFLGLRRGGFFEWNFNISFCRISNPSFYLNKNELKKNC